MRYVWALGVLIIITALLSMLSPGAWSASHSAPPGMPAYIPPPRAQDAVVMQHGFDALVSFTGSAFEPATLTIKRGDTIRFTNNASAPLQFANSNTDLFAGTGAIAPRSYAEVTFTQSGQFHYSDAKSGMSGTVIVR